MKLLGAFLKLVRWPNLFFIGLTQFLFYFCILQPSFGIIAEYLPPIPFYYDRVDTNFQNVLKPPVFYLLSLSSILIAAAGYIINDYFDLNIDRINKPDKIVVEKIIKRRWAIVWHWALSGLGILISFYISFRLRNIFIGPANFLCVLLLYFYSTTFKKKLLIGNIVIACLTAWVIFVLYMCEFRFHRFTDPLYQHTLSRVFKYTILYAGFAFIISLVREVVKDIEDMNGDARYGCKTMPVVWGVNVAKVFAATWLTVLLAALVIVLFYVSQYGWWVIIAYGILLVIIPLIAIIRRLYQAESPPDYHRLSNAIKLVMLAGILSIGFFKLYQSWIA